MIFAALTLKPQESGSTTAPTQTAGYALCDGHALAYCVIDGDTIRHGGAKIRLADIDAPEVSEPRCAAERALGERATRRLHELIDGEPVRILEAGARNLDRYGRQLRIIEVDGRSVGETLIAEGLAVRWGGGRPDWCS